MAITESPARIVRQLLVDLDQGVMADGSNTAWQASVNVEPASPDNAITVYNTEAKDDGRIAFTGQRVEHPGILVRVRASNDADGWSRARELCLALDAVLRREVVVNSVTFLVQELKRTSTVIPLGYDTPTTKRYIYTINLTFSVWALP